MRVLYVLLCVCEVWLAARVTTTALFRRALSFTKACFGCSVTHFKSMLCCVCTDTFSMRDDPLASITFPVPCPILIADAASGRVARFLIPEAGQMERFKAEVRTIA